MAFNQNNFAPIGGHGTNTPNYYSYFTEDDGEEVVSSGYFNDKRFQLKPRDIIQCQSSTGFLWLDVNNSSKDVTVLENTILDISTQFQLLDFNDIDWRSLRGTYCIIESGSVFSNTPFKVLTASEYVIIINTTVSSTALTQTMSVTRDGVTDIELYMRAGHDINEVINNEWTMISNPLPVRGLLSFEDSALTTIMLAADTPTRINAIWGDGNIEEQICFRDKVNFDNTTNTLTTIDLNVELAAGTAFNHNLSNGDVVTLMANGGLPAELSSIDYFVGDVTATTYRLYSDSGLTDLVEFTDDGTGPNYYDHQQGDSASGWFVYIGVNDAFIDINGWITAEKAQAAEAPVRGVIMKSGVLFNIARESNGSTFSSKNNVSQSSQVSDIIDFTTGEGFLVYVENRLGTVNNIVTDARITVILA